MFMKIEHPNQLAKLVFDDRDYGTNHPNAAAITNFFTTPLIGADGQPKAECFIPGNIHMLPAGYAVWKSVIAPVVVPAEKPFEKGR